MIIIGITGLSCSGKTTLSKNLQNYLGKEQCLLISTDDYYKELTEEQYKVLHNDSAEINFDTPERIDFSLLKNNLKDIKNNNPVEIPKFDLGSCLITSWQHIPANTYKYVIVEGVFVFSDADVVNLCNLKIWVECKEYICALRRFIKFTQSIKGYTPDYVYNQCVKFVIPGQEKYIKPVKHLCDLTLNGESEDNKISEAYLEMITKLIAN